MLAESVRSLTARTRCSLLDVMQIAVPAFLLLFFTYTIADADLWGHLRFGADLLHGHGFTLKDPYSFTSDTPWINHEWLAEVCVAAFYAVGGAIGLNLLKLVVIATIGAIVWTAGRHYSASRFALIWVTGLIVFAGYTRTQVLRPQLFSVLLFTILMIVLRRREQDRHGSILTLPILFCLWANAHGGWLVGYASLCVWAAAVVVERRTFSCFWRRSVEVVASLAATLINPYGFGMWSFLRETVGLDRDISDWTPFLKFPAALIAIELLLPAIAVMALWRRRRLPPVRHAAIIAILAFGTYRVGRVDAFFQVAVGVLLLPDLLALFSEIEGWLRRQHRLTNRAPVHACAAVVLASYAVVVAAGHVRSIRIDGTWIPDPEAMRFLKTDAAHARVLTWFDWGEYAIWHLSPGGTQVSMDGRRETVYSARVLEDHWAFYKNEKDGSSYPEKIGAEMIWLPKKFAIVPILKDKGWHVAFESDVSVVFSRNPSPPPPTVQVTRASRVFPGP